MYAAHAVLQAIVCARFGLKWVFRHFKHPLSFFQAYCRLIEDFWNLTCCICSKTCCRAKP